MPEKKVDPQKIVAEVERLRAEFSGDSIKISARPNTETKFSVTTPEGEKVIKNGTITRVPED